MESNFFGVYIDIPEVRFKEYRWSRESVSIVAMTPQTQNSAQEVVLRLFPTKFPRENFQESVPIAKILSEIIDQLFASIIFKQRR